jgi:integrase
VIDGRSPLALDLLAVGVLLLDDKELPIEFVNDGRRDGCHSHGAEFAAVFEHVPTDHPEADFVVALRSGVELREAPVRPVFRKHPIKCPRRGDSRRTEPVTSLKVVDFLVSRLYDACFVVIAYLVGARASEILGLKTGCIAEHPSADGTETFTYLSGRIYKTADTPAGQPHRWVAPAPVVRAVTVLERLSEPVRRRAGREELWLTPAADGDGSFHVRRSYNFTDHLNGPFAAFIDLPLHDGRPWHLSTHQGRKTFARFVGRRDRTGLHALAAHL